MNSADSRTELHIPVPVEHRCFPDHFPGAPLVPGALLLKWILALLAAQQSVHVRYIKQVKFLAPVQPGDNVKLLLATGKDSQQIAVDAYVNGILVLKGQFETALEKPVQEDTPND